MTMDVSGHAMQSLHDIVLDNKYLDTDFFHALFIDNISMPLGVNKHCV